LCWQSGFIRWLDVWQPQVLIVESNPRYLSTPAAIRWMHRRGGKVIGWGLGAPQPKGALAGLKRRLWGGFIRQFDALIAYSSAGAQQYIALGAPPERVFTASNAVAHQPAQPPPKRAEQFDPAGALILFVGRLQARKRIDLLLAACAGLPESLRPRLWVVGDGPARAELQVAAQSVYPSAQFFGARRGAELDALFAQADVFVLPGTGGLAVQQAMSFALPVVVAEGDGTQADLVRPGNGWQVPPGDEAALRQTLQQALSDAPRLRQMGLESYRIVRDEINLEQMVRVFVRAVESVSR
jgi:glycosyltransferase involved in cell wall biosynthesis